MRELLLMSFCACLPASLPATGVTTWVCLALYLIMRTLRYVSICIPARAVAYTSIDLGVHVCWSVLASAAAWKCCYIYMCVFVCMCVGNVFTGGLRLMSLFCDSLLRNGPVHLCKPVFAGSARSQ